MGKFNVGDTVRVKENKDDPYLHQREGEPEVITDIKVGGNDPFPILTSNSAFNESELELVESATKKTLTEITKAVRAMNEAKEFKSVGLSPADPVGNPLHYTSGKIEVWDFIVDQGFNYLRGNIVKYIARAGKKDKNTELQDLEKALAYLQREIKRVKSDNPS